MKGGRGRASSRRTPRCGDRRRSLEKRRWPEDEWRPAYALLAHRSSGPRAVVSNLRLGRGPREQSLPVPGRDHRSIRGPPAPPARFTCWSCAALPAAELAVATRTRLRSGLAPISSPRIRLPLAGQMRRVVVDPTWWAIAIGTRIRGRHAAGYGIDDFCRSFPPRDAGSVRPVPARGRPLPKRIC